jgi:hypothetical protein
VALDPILGNANNAETLVPNLNRISAVLSQFTHLMTLLAFATHVVMGCCAHHGHGSGDICCQSGADFQSVEHPNVARRSPAETSCTSRRDCCGHEQSKVAQGSPGDSSCNPSPNDCESEQHQPNSSSYVEFSLADTNSTPPSGPSHECEGGECTYISNSSGHSCIALDLYVAPCPLIFQLAWVSMASNNSAWSANHGDDAFGYLSQTRCALCQSWQI